MKKLFALLLAVAMVLSMVACGDKAPEATEAPTTEATEANEPATYTYNAALSEFPTNWNPHTYQTNIDAEIVDYLNDGFYVFDYNETKDGYALVPGMAVDFPVDVTADYIGQYGLVEGDEARAWKITIRDDLKWQDGRAITAQDFVESVKRLLAPEAQNYRADSLYTGNMVIHNAENYIKQGKTVKVNNTEFLDLAALVKGEDGNYTTPDGAALYISLNDADAPNCSGYSLTDLAGMGYVQPEVIEGLQAVASEDGYVPFNDETKALLFTFTGSDNWGNEPESTIPTYLYHDKTYAALDFAEVGYFAPSDTEIVIVMDKPLSGFYLHYSLGSTWLIDVELYDSLASVKDGVYTNTYGTSAETISSYGPFVLTSFQADKQFTMKRNENYYGLTEDNYQITDYVVDCVPEASTRLELFLQGKLDTYGLTADDMEKYSLSDATYYTTGDSTFAMVFNPDLEALKTTQAAAGANINKTILTLPEFRMAMSYGLDRAAFCLAVAPTNNAAFGLYSSVIVSDPENGTAYRTTETAKTVLANFWGVSEDYGEGKLYADLDEAVESITGYNLAKSQEMFNTAYDKAIEQGMMDEDDVVEIKIGTPNNTSKFYNNGYEFLVNNYTEAVKGTKLEGKLTFSRDDTLGNAFSDAIKNNSVDMLFGVGWTGSTLDPYSLIEAYIKPDYQYDDAIDYNTVMQKIEIDGVVYNASVMDWYNAMMGTPVTLTAEDKSTIEFSCGTADNNPEVRLHVLGALEAAVLMNYTFVPIMNEATAALKGQQIQYYTEEYIFGMGFGGLKYYTFNYTDAEWDAYVAENGGTLDYA